MDSAGASNASGKVIFWMAGNHDQNIDYDKYDKYHKVNSAVGGPPNAPHPRFISLVGGPPTSPPPTGNRLLMSKQEMLDILSQSLE